MLRTYDDWKSTDPRDTDPCANGVPVDPPAARGECCICCDGGQGAPCSPDCLRIHDRAVAKRKAARLRVTCRQALRLVRTYRAEGDGLASPRLLATLARFGELRAELRQAQAVARGQA